MVSFLNALGAGVAGAADFGAKAMEQGQKDDMLNARQQSLFGQQTSIEQMRIDAQNKAAVLADQMAAAREHTGRVEQFGFQTQLKTQEEAARAAEAERGRVAASALKDRELVPTEVRTFRELQKMTPEERRLFMQQEAQKKGDEPSWMIDFKYGDKSAPAQPSTQATGSSADGGAGGSTIVAPSVTPPTDPTKTAKPAEPTKTATTGSDTGDVRNDPKEDPNVTAQPIVKQILTAPATGRNEEFLAKLPPQAQFLVKSMVEGRTAPPTSKSQEKQYWQTMMDWARTYDPSFDEAAWPERVAVRKSLASGKLYDSIVALNTALGHAGEMSNAFKEQGNLAVPLLNLPLNWVGSNVGGTTTLGKAEMTRDALAGEMRKVFAGSSGGSLTELEEWKKDFPVNGSAAQQQQAVQKAVVLLKSRMDAITDQVNSNLGRTANPIDLLKPHQAEIFKQLTGNSPTGTTIYNTGAPNRTPQQMYGTGSGTDTAATLPPLPPGNWKPLQ